MCGRARIPVFRPMIGLLNQLFILSGASRINCQAFIEAWKAQIGLDASPNQKNQSVLVALSDRFQNLNNSQTERSEASLTRLPKSNVICVPVSVCPRTKLRTNAWFSLLHTLQVWFFQPVLG